MKPEKDLSKLKKDNSVNELRVREFVSKCIEDRLEPTVPSFEKALTGRAYDHSLMSDRT